MRPPETASPFVSNFKESATLFLCGGWLALAPAVLPVEPVALVWSDRTAGVLLMLCAVLSWRFRALGMQWVEGLLGTWLLAAPLIFWTPDLATYVNETVVGTVVLALSLVIPYSRRTGGTERPPGWSYNPSAWSQRIPIVVIGLLAFGVAAYMASFQLGHFESVWDPFFGEGTRRVLHSEVSKAFPVSDAGLGAFTYLVEALAGVMGDSRRWRTMPWVVLLFGFLVVPAGVVSIVLVILQPWAVGAWCTLCLVSALLCLATLPPAMDEAIASIQFILEARRSGASFWHALFRGEQLPCRPEDESVRVRTTESWIDLQTPWNLGLSTALGLWMMVSPGVLHETGLLAHLHTVTGALVITFSVMAMAECGRSIRFLNVPLGAWMLVMPWLFDPQNSMTGWSGVITGILVILLSWRRGRVEEHFGTWDRYIV